MFQPYLSCFGSVTPSKVIPLGQAECSHLCSPEFSMCMSSLLPYVEVWPPPLQKLHRSCFSIQPMVDELFPLHASIGASMACSSSERSIPYPSDFCCFINPALVVSCDENILTFFVLLFSNRHDNQQSSRYVKWFFMKVPYVFLNFGR